MTDQSKIRNFSIIAHIDHGKSTLSDRLIEKCNAVSQREMESQLLDNMDLERERGITIKARAVKLNYQAADGETYELNLIDTPGHVDFNYEVSRSLAACEGAVLIVDAAQGIEAQTLANTFLALEHDLEILPVVNKIDLPAADPKRVKDEIENIIGLPAQDAPEISAKVGLNIDAVLEDIVKNVPAPKGDPEAPLRALIFDSQYDAYRGVIVYFRVMEGTIKTGMKVKMMASGASYEVLECGHLLPLGMEPCGELIAGEVGYFTASIKNVKDTQVGDTVTGVERPAAEALPGYRPARAMVYCGIYTEDGSKYPDLRDALEKLQLNDASLSFEPESSAALGFGFRCGFLGMLHMEIIQERLEREFDLDLITTLPSVIYRITKTDGTVVMVDNPHNYPESGGDRAGRGALRQGVHRLAARLCGQHHAHVPGASGRVQGHAVSGHQPGGAALLACLSARSSTTFSTPSRPAPRATPRWTTSWTGYQPVRAGEGGYPAQRRSGGRAVASSPTGTRPTPAPGKHVRKAQGQSSPASCSRSPSRPPSAARSSPARPSRAMRKDVLAKCYGGDITRKKKLLEKQKEGKKKMRSLGTVQIPTEAFMAVLKLDEE